MSTRGSRVTRPRRSLAVLALAAAVLLCAAACAAATAATAVAAVPAWTSYDHDGGRSATDPDSASPVTPTPAWPAATPLDGEVFSQPLVAGSRVYVATENDTVYALDAATGTVLWRRSVGTAVPSTDLPCGDISPTVGITSTPVIDAQSGRIYVVADDISSGSAHHRLVALNLSDGSVVAGFPVAADPPGADPLAILQRASLALTGGRIVIPYGGNAGDCGTYHGWLVSEPESGAGTPNTFEVNPGAGEHGGAIWGSGGAPAVDGAGDILVSTGNGFGSTAPDYQESVLALDPTLHLLASWTPTNWLALDNSDQDMGSAQPVLLPGGLLFEIGKDGVGRLLATTPGAITQVFSATACPSGGGFGSSLYRAGVIYVPCSKGLVALALTTGANPSFTALPGFSAPPGATGPPIFAGGRVWSTGWRSSQLLYGLDPSTGAVSSQSAPGTFHHFATPSAGGGRLFVAAGSTVSALTIARFPPATATALSSAANPATTGTVVLTAAVTPAPDAGTVAFTVGSAPLAGCAAVAVDPSSGRAGCRATLSGGEHSIVATYSGDAFFGPSSSPALVQVVRGPSATARPRLSGARLGSRRVRAGHTTRLRFRLSRRARVTVTVSRSRAGHRRRGRCTTHVTTGRRCTLKRVVLRRSLSGRRGSNTVRLSLGRLAPGHYLVTIGARAGGRAATPAVLRLDITRHRR
jgi:outer membrane protein assembly factor BamB